MFCGFQREIIGDFPIPFVRVSGLKVGLELVETVPLEINGTILLIGEVSLIALEKDALGKEGYIDLGRLSATGISGLNSYYSLKKLADYPFARPDAVRAERIKR